MSNYDLNLLAAVAGKGEIKESQISEEFHFQVSMKQIVSQGMYCIYLYKTFFLEQKNFSFDIFLNRLTHEVYPALAIVAKCELQISRINYSIITK